jgi:hypothetical protein
MDTHALTPRTASHRRSGCSAPLTFAYFQIEERDEVGKIREKVTGKLVGLDTALGLILSVFLTLLDVPVQDPHW